MANPLTGNYEAVVQIAIWQINGILATLHGNAATQDTALKLLHSATLRIGDPPRKKPHVEVFGNWLIEYQKASPGRGLDDLRAQLTAMAPPGATQMLSTALEELDRDWVIKYPPDVVHGTVKLQVSCVTITVPDGSSSVNESELEV